MNDTPIANLLPAILLGGPPHSGKSVLASLLDVALKELNIPHILLLTAPDGEGAWFLESASDVRAALRHKGTFTPDYVEGMIRAVRRRALPMLVDVGGQPQGRQFELLQACTHSIVLAERAEDLATWQQRAEDLGLISIAVLRSTLDGQEAIEPGDGPLRGVISGLDRNEPRGGAVFSELLARVAGICRYDAAVLDQAALRYAPPDYTIVMEHDLARQLGVRQEGQRNQWQESDLARLDEALPRPQPLALYGDGPMFLTAAIAARNAPQPVWTFDARHYGWMRAPAVQTRADAANEQFTLTVEASAARSRLLFELLPDHHVLAPQPVVLIPPLDPALGVELHGKMPKWLWAALARHLATRHPWLAAYYPQEKRFLRVWERSGPE
ncbi:MAG: hypothetical protein WAZ19_14885 [Anaerolineae bacterium]